VEGGERKEGRKGREDRGREGRREGGMRMEGGKERRRGCFSSLTKRTFYMRKERGVGMRTSISGAVYLTTAVWSSNSVAPVRTSRMKLLVGAGGCTGESFLLGRRELNMYPFDAPTFHHCRQLKFEKSFINFVRRTWTSQQGFEFDRSHIFP
jgi:hypothetical protein